VGCSFHALTPNRSRDSSRWRGKTVTSSISQRKATSAGVKPRGRGRAILDGGGGGKDAPRRVRGEEEQSLSGGGRCAVPLFLAPALTSDLGCFSRLQTTCISASNCAIAGSSYCPIASAAGISMSSVPLAHAKVLFAVLVQCATSYAWQVGQRVLEPYLV
jgi:hypothetical protein